MGNKFFNKFLAFVIIFLFVGVSVGICDFEKTNSTLTESQELTDNTINSCNCEKNKQVIIGDDSILGGLTSDDIIALQKQIETQGWTYNVSENPATEYSIDELCGLVEPTDWWVDAEFDTSLPTSVLPESFDWREEAGGLPPIRNQGSCGSCWAFGTIAPIECNIKIKDGITVDLSEQWLVSCNQNGYSCRGGWWCHQYFKGGGKRTDPCGDNGAVLEQYFPYVAYNAPCNCPYPHKYSIESAKYVGAISGVATVDQIKQAIYDYGPVSVAVCVNSAFQAYSGGIFNGPTSHNINHAVALVGWDDNQGTNGVWFLRNSWGPGWGENGYMRIEYGVCDVGYATVRVNYIGFQPPNIPTIVGPAIGAAGEEYSYTVIATDPNYDDIYLHVDWGDGTSTGWIGPYSSGEQVNLNYTWSSPGEYEISSKAKDVYDNSSKWADPLSVRMVIDNSPNTPIIIGTRNVKPGVYYTYNFFTIDPENDHVYYCVDWGDGDITEWIGPYNSAEIAKIAHYWEEKGTYILKVKAKDYLGLVSPYAKQIIIMPQGRIVDRSLPHFIKNIIENHSNFFSTIQRLFQRLGQ